MLVYIFLRKNVIPNISLINKYRKNIILDRISVDIKKLENPSKNIPTMHTNLDLIPYYYNEYSLEDFQQFDSKIDKSFEKSGLRWEFYLVIFYFIYPIAVENIFKDYVKSTVNKLYSFSNITKTILSIQLFRLYYNLTKRSFAFLNLSDLSENSDSEIIEIKELIKN